MAYVGFSWLKLGGLCVAIYEHCDLNEDTAKFHDIFSNYQLS